MNLTGQFLLTLLECIEVVQADGHGGDERDEQDGHEEDRLFALRIRSEPDDACVLVFAGSQLRLFFFFLLLFLLHFIRVFSILRCFLFFLLDLTVTFNLVSFSILFHVICKLILLFNRVKGDHESCEGAQEYQEEAHD